jgi:hypothetical protein
MSDVDVRHAKKHLEELIVRAGQGEEVCISDPLLGTVRLQSVPRRSSMIPTYPLRVIGLMPHLAEIPEKRMFAPLTSDELAWLSGEQSGAN